MTLLLFSSVSGMMVVIALQQNTRAGLLLSADKLHIDDGFWSLLSRSFLQLLSAFLHAVSSCGELRAESLSDEILVS